MIARHLVDVSVSHEVTVFRRQLGFRHLLHQRFRSSSVSYQIGDGCYLEIMFFRELKKFCRPHHGSVFTHDLAA